MLTDADAERLQAIEARDLRTLELLRQVVVLYAEAIDAAATGEKTRPILAQVKRTTSELNQMHQQANGDIGFLLATVRELSAENARLTAARAGQQD